MFTTDENILKLCVPALIKHCPLIYILSALSCECDSVHCSPSTASVPHHPDAFNRRIAYDTVCSFTFKLLPLCYINSSVGNSQS